MGFVDMHSHILPGLDDGSKNIESSIEMLKIAASEGIRVIIATPHNMPGKGRPSREKLEERLVLLQDAAEGEGIDIELRLGTEYYYREEVSEIFDREDAVTMAESDCVLLEFNPMEEKSYIYNAVRETYSAGYTPIIAHVERYDKLMKKPEEYVKELRSMGAFIQVNASSVIGPAGFGTKRIVKKLLKAGYVDFISTDAHSSKVRAPRMQKCAEYLYKKYDKSYVDKLLFKNAVKYLL